MEHFQYWKWLALSNLTASMHSDITDALTSAGLAHIRDTGAFPVWLSLQRKVLPIFNVSHVNVLLDHYRACLYTLYLPEQLCPPGINNESQALQLTTWGCFPIITPCSGLPAFHFSMFICAQQMPSLPIHQWTSRRVYVAALRVLTLDPWVTYSMGTEVYFASGCESLNLLECY